MRNRLTKPNLVTGILLIYFGVVQLIETFIDLTVWGWVGALAVAGFFVFLVYLQDRSEWGYLIPAYIFWAIAGMIVLIALRILQDEAIATYVLAAIALPFVVGYLRNRKRWGLLIPAYVLLAVGLMVWMIGLGWLDDLLIPAYVNLAIALPFFLVYVLNPKNWWALIPGGIMAVIGASFLLATPAVRFVVPVVLIVAGVWVLFRQLIKKSNG
jgi:hypothetical protein